MGKTYIDTVKYVIRAEYEIEGIVEKPDIIGAIFGQTEGLLGEGLDLRELQKSGRIGRIEVSTNVHDGKTSGEIEIPSSLDSVNTSILAAGVEAVDRIGPCKGWVKILKIEDTRTAKREVVVSRAQEIFKQMMQKGPDSREITDEVREKTKTSEVETYGPEELAIGPDINGPEIIIVEGRADVIALLKADIKNVISLQGKIIPKTVIELVKGKEVTVFIDGDRGGDLIIKQLATTTRIAYIAKAPDGKEVEELTQKEILKCLKKRMTFPEYMKTQRPAMGMERHEYRRSDERTDTYKRPFAPRTTSYQARAPYHAVAAEPNPFENEIRGLEGTLTGIIIDSKANKTDKIEVKNLRETITNAVDPKVLIFDGVITQSLVDLAKEKNMEVVVGIKKGNLISTRDIKIYTLA